MSNKKTKTVTGRGATENDAIKNAYRKIRYGNYTVQSTIVTELNRPIINKYKAKLWYIDNTKN